MPLNHRVLRSGGTPATASAAPGSSGGLGSAGGLADLNTHQAHLFDLSGAPSDEYDGGQLRHANEETFPIVAGQDVSAVLVRLEPGAVREPHWHPSAWELHYVLSGTARFSVLETEAYREQFEARTGHLVFLPQAGFHYFENTSATEDYVALLVFNTSAREPKDDIGLVAALNVIPRDVLGKLFGVSPDAFSAVPGKVGRVTITRGR